MVAVPNAIAVTSASAICSLISSHPGHGSVPLAPDGHARTVRPVIRSRRPLPSASIQQREGVGHGGDRSQEDRKSTRLNSSHVAISYAVFCLKKKKMYIIL